MRFLVVLLVGTAMIWLLRGYPGKWVKSKPSLGNAISMEVSTGKVATVAVSDDLYGYDHSGAGMSYTIPESNEIYWTEVGDATDDGGIEGFTAGYSDDNGTAHHGINITRTGIRALVNDDQKESVGWIVSDPEGVIIKGKEVGGQDFALSVVSGPINNEASLSLGVRNDGRVRIGSLAGEGQRIVQVDDQGYLSIRSIDSVYPFRLDPPKTSFSNGKVGEFCLDDNYVYFCIAPNTWRRTKLENW